MSQVQYLGRAECELESLHILRDWVKRLNTILGMPVTTKIIVLITHVKQWVDILGRSLGKEGEQGGEAIHHIWKQQLESIGEPKEKESEPYKRVVMKTLLMINNNHV